MTADDRACVLVVDDEPDVRDVLALLLTSCGYRVITARNGAEALEAMRRTRPAIVLLDLMMPVMNGWQFRAEQLRDPSLADVPVVVFTGAGAAARKTAFSGAMTVIEKPVAMDDLLQVVEEHARRGDDAAT